MPGTPGFASMDHRTGGDAGARVKVATIGECMLELSDMGGGACALACGGDTLNTAVYMARLGIPVDYATALGDDPYSEWMVETWRREGVGTHLVARLAGRVPGLYMIRTDGRGERTFYYWRDRAPARELLEREESASLVRALAAYDLVYVSGITASIYGPRGRDALVELMGRTRAAGGLVAFDGNYRARGWIDPAEAREVLARMAAHADIALPTLDDERMVFGDRDAAACARRLREGGAREVVVKQGGGGCLVATAEAATEVASERVTDPVDTTAAGDSFNAGYLAARLSGATPVDAARVGHTLAAAVIQHRGAIIPRDAMPSIALARRREGART